MIDEDEISSGMTYRRPKDEHVPYKKEPKIQSCEEKEELQVPQYKTIVLKSRVLEGIREHYNIPMSYKTYCLDATQRIHIPIANYVTTYVAYLLAGLRFPLHLFLLDICKYYKVQLGKLM